MVNKTGNPTPDYIYVASSWKNNYQQSVVNTLRSYNIKCYDFRNPEDSKGFSWAEVLPVYSEGADPNGDISLSDYFEALEHPRAIEGYNADFAAMQKADLFLLVLPCGRSAHLELGWAVGQGKRTIILFEDSLTPVTPELMYRMVDFFAHNMSDLLWCLGVEA